MTVLFADLTGFTAASDGADVEEVHAHVQPWLRIARDATETEGGRVVRVLGDGVMAMWGYETAHEDDALRATRAGLRMLERLAREAPGRHARVGINTGEALLTFDAPFEDADDAMGDAVNIAARLQGAAGLDEVLLGETTQALLRGGVTVEALPPLRLKGKTAPVVAWRAVRTADERPDAWAPDGSDPFVGRDAQLAALRDALAEAMSTGALRRVVVAGEPGIGKSRLVAELRRSAPAVTRWLVGRCRPGTGEPLAAWGEIVRGWAGINDAAPGTTVVDPAERLRRAVPADAADRAWLVRLLAPLAGATGTATADDEVPAAEERHRAWAWVAALAGAGGPAVLLVEDVHWADDELVAFLASAELGAVAAPVLLVVTARPEGLERHPALVTVAAVTRLDPLPASEETSLLDALAARHGLDDAERRLVAGRSDGNPLFAAELARYVVAARQAPSAGALPATVHAVITSRLDLLPGDVRGCARDAAVIGERFTTNAVATVGRMDRPAAASALRQLERLELIVRVDDEAGPGDAAWAFRHALVRDAAYGQLTRVDRAVRHASAADWLDGSGGGRPEALGLAADHRLRALELARARGGAPGLDLAALTGLTVETLLRAGAVEASLDQRAATGRFRAAAPLARDAVQRIRVLEALAGSACAAGLASESLEATDAALGAAREAGDRLAAGRLIGIRARARRIAGEPGWLDDVLLAVQALEPLGDTPELLHAYGQATLLELAAGTAGGILRWAARAEALAGRLGAAMPADTLERRGFARIMTGDTGGIEDIEEAIERARHGPDSRVLAEAMADLGNVRMYLGEVEAALATFRDGGDLAAARGLGTTAIDTRLNGGSCLRHLGRFDEFDALVAELDAAAAELGYERVRMFIAYEQFHGAIARDDDAGAVAALERCEARAADHPAIRMLLGIARAVAAGRRGDAPGFRAAVGDWPPDEPDDLDNHDVAAFPALARAAVACGEVSYVARLRAAIGGAYPLGMAVRDALEGIAAAGRGDGVAASVALDRAADAFERFGMTPEAAVDRAWAASAARGTRPPA